MDRSDNGPSGGDLLCILNSPAHGQRAVIQLGAQFFAFQRFRDDEGRALVLADVINRQNVGMVERRGGACFLLKAA